MWERRKSQSPQRICLSQFAIQGQPATGSSTIAIETRAEKSPASRLASLLQKPGDVSAAAPNVFWLLTTPSALLLLSTLFKSLLSRGGALSGSNAGGAFVGATRAPLLWERRKSRSPQRICLSQFAIQGQPAAGSSTIAIEARAEKSPASRLASLLQKPGCVGAVAPNAFWLLATAFTLLLASTLF